MKTITILLSFLHLSYSFAQNTPKEGMIYDEQNTMYYRISHDEQYLYLNFYKDEYARKATNLGGIKLFFNTAGKKDTLNVPSIVYPVYKHPKEDFNLIAVSGFSSIPDGKMSVYNEHGLTAEAKFTELPSKSMFARDQSIFEGKISIPVSILKTGENKSLSIMVLLRGIRLIPIPPGASMGTAYNSSPEQETYFLDTFTWTYSWIYYKLK